MTFVVVLDSNQVPDFFREDPLPVTMTKAVPRSLHAPDGRSRLCLLFTGRERALTHVGAVPRPRGRQIATMEWQLSIERILPVGAPMSIDQLSAHMKTLHSNRLRDAVAQRFDILPTGAADECAEAIRKLRPHFAESLAWIAQAGVRTVIRDSAGLAWALQRDAVRLCLRIGGYPEHELAMWNRPDGDDTPFLRGMITTSDAPEVGADSLLTELLDRSPEPSLTEHDARIPPSGWNRIASNRAHIHVFTDGRRRLEVMNVNATGVERGTGVDLIYYHRNTRSFVFVQYKALDNDRTPVNDQFLSQVDRMTRLSRLNRGPLEPHEWRIGQDCCYHKLARTDGIDANDTRPVPGLYLPLSYTKLLLQHRSTEGSGGGKSLGYHNVDRHISK